MSSKILYKKPEGRSPQFLSLVIEMSGLVPQPASLSLREGINVHLFVIYIGGSHNQSLIELHDMRFVVANNIEDTYSLLRQSWWGFPQAYILMPGAY